MRTPRAQVEKLESNQETGVYFWQIREFVPKLGRYEAIQFGSHVTKFTPKWCPVCKRAFKTTCVCAPSPVPVIRRFKPEENER